MAAGHVEPRMKMRKFSTAGGNISSRAHARLRGESQIGTCTCALYMVCVCVVALESSESSVCLSE